MDTKKEFEAMLSSSLKETGARVKQVPAEIALYMSERSAHLSTIVNEPGFDQAVRAERNNVAMRAGIATHNAASQMDFQLLGLIEGALRVAAVALA